MTDDLARLAAGTASAFLALLFLRAAIHKATDLGWFEGVLAAYRVPSAVSAEIARALLALEGACAILLLMPGARRAGAGLAVVLLTTYGAAMAAQLAQGVRLADCGCGGAPQALSWTAVARNGALAAAAAPSIIGVGGAHDLAEALVMGGCAAAVFVGWIAIEQLAANDALMRRRTPRSVFAGDFVAPGGAP